jgi:hypothetical protein
MSIQIVRTSDRQYFKRCRQLWDFTSKIRQNYEPYQRPIAMDFGSAFHAAMEAYYNPKTWNDTISHTQESARLAFLDYIHELEQKVKMGPLEFETDYMAQKMLGLDMLEHYFIWAPPHDTFTPVYTEVEFEVPIPGFPEAVYQGRIDMLAEDVYGYWIVDHKTAAQFSGTEWLALDDQCGSYAWAIQKQLGLEVRGVIYNQIRKKAPHLPKVLKSGALSVNKQQDTSYETFYAYLKQHNYQIHPYQDFLDYLRANPKEFVRRIKVQYTQQQLMIVEKRIQQEAREMLQDPVIYPSPSPMNCNGCLFFRPCLALQEGSDYQLILDELYEKRRPSATQGPAPTPYGG